MPPKEWQIAPLKEMFRWIKPRLERATREKYFCIGILESNLVKNIKGIFALEGGGSLELAVSTGCFAALILQLLAGDTWKKSATQRAVG